MPACSLNRPLAALSLPLPHSLPSKPSLQCSQSPPSLSSTSTISKHSSNVMVTDDSFTIAAIVEAVSLASAAVEAAKDAVSSALALKQQLSDGCLSENGVAAWRRKRMRKRKKTTAFCDSYEDGVDSGWSLIKGCSSRSERSRYLTRRQEAEFSFYLKVYLKHSFIFSFEQENMRKKKRNHRCGS